MFFVIDSSSVLIVGEYAKKYGVRKTEILNSLKSLVDDGKLVYPVQVVDEVSRHSRSEQSRWVSENKGRASRYGTDYNALKEIMSHKIASKVIDVSKHDNVNEADPYLLELALRLKNRPHLPLGLESSSDCAVTLITEEVKNKASKVSLSQAAGVLGIPCLRMEFFLLNEGIVA